jgi:hypothetical protein
MKYRYFIAVYTNQVKDYCDHQFFTNLYQLSNGQDVFIVDNTIGTAYYDRLINGCTQNGFANFNVYHLDIDGYPVESRFQRNVCDSVNYLRDLFLDRKEYDYFLIIESDVYPPADLLIRFDESVDKLDATDPAWGIVGGIYYPGFHDYEFNTSQTSLERTGHCLSGCTVYKRTLLEKYPFRYDPDVLGSFPDFWISFDAGKEYSLWNEHLIRCEHLHNPVNGGRTS